MDEKKIEKPKASPRPDPKKAPWPPRFSLDDWREALEETRQKELRDAPKTVQVFPGYD
jgi:hypothetical protein